MYDCYDDQYYEPTDADIIFEEAKSKLEEVLKNNIKNKIESLTEENRRLKERNEILIDQVNDISRRERELERDRTNLNRDKLSDLMKDREIVMYKVDYKYKHSKPCGKCDENRNIAFESPSGKEMKEKCGCFESYRVYYPEEYICYEMRKNSRDNSLTMWYRKYHDSDDGYTSGIAVKKPWNGESFDELNIYSTYFKTREECQLYCDWLAENKQED